VIIWTEDSNEPMVRNDSSWMVFSERLRRQILHSWALRLRVELLSPKVSLLVWVLLAISLFATFDHTLIEQELSSQFLPKPATGSVDSNRPISTCAPTNSIPKGHHGSGNCPLNFTLALRQESVIQVQGSSSLVQLSVTLVSGSSTPVTLTGQGIPAGIQIQFAPESARPSFSSIMTITTSGATPLGQFNITIFAASGGLVKSRILSLMIVPFVHDIAVVSATVQATAKVGNIVSVNATVGNYGSVSEEFELRAYANTTLVAKLSMLRLAASSIYVGRLTWNTTGFSPGAYTVLVTVPPVQGELNSLDNSRDAGKILLTQAPGSPNPSPAASGGRQVFNYGRQLAIIAAIAEVAVVILVVLRKKGKASTRDASIASRKI
jgi:CARDB